MNTVSKFGSASKSPGSAAAGTKPDNARAGGTLKKEIFYGYQHSE
jgi:hypothetical protein